MYNKDLKRYVHRILIEMPKTRDSDALLVAGLLWKHPEMPDPRKITAMELLNLWNQGKLPSLASIERARRKIQKAHPELRGELYDKRQSSQKKWRRSLGYRESSAM